MTANLRWHFDEEENWWVANSLSYADTRWVIHQGAITKDYIIQLEGELILKLEEAKTLRDELSAAIEEAERLRG